MIALQSADARLLEVERLEVGVTEIDASQYRVVRYSKRWPLMAIGRGAREWAIERIS